MSDRIIRRALLSFSDKTGLLDLTSLPGFDPLRVNVTTAHRVVYLMGIVTHEEDDAVTQIARDTEGVEKVVKVFEYTEIDQKAAPGAE